MINHYTILLPIRKPAMFRLFHIVVLSVSLFAFQCFSYAASIENVDINGYLSFEYEKTIGGDNVGDTNGSFDIDLIDIVFNVRVTDRLRIGADITWEHGAATEENRGNVAIEYAFAEYTKKDWLRFRAGKMFTTFGIYNEIHTAKPATLTVKEPLSTNKNNKFGSQTRFYPRWLNGIAVQGDIDLAQMQLDYDIQLSNGDTEENNHNPFEKDDNTHKAFNGRVRVHANDELRVGFSFYNDSMEDKNSTNRLDIASYGLQLEWQARNGFGIEIEWVSGKEVHKLANEIDRYAYTIMFSQPITKRIIPYFRFEQLEPNKDIPNDSASLSIFGVNLQIDTGMYIKMEVDKNVTQNNNTDFSGSDWIEFKTSLAIGF